MVNSCPKVIILQENNWKDAMCCRIHLKYGAYHRDSIMGCPNMGYNIINTVNMPFVN